MNDILAVIPTYNERESIQDITRAIFREYEALDILFVDDNSPDGTGQLADAIAAKDPRVHVLHRSGKQGLGRAYIAGFKWALEQSYQFIFEMDADFSHNPADIPRLLLSAQKADLVLGSRYIGGVRVINWPLNRLILSRGAGIYVQLITGMPFTDPTGGFKCYRRAVLEEINLNAVRSNGYSFQIEMTHKTWQMGFQIQEVPITFEERRSGLSKMNASIVREALWMVWKLWFQAGLRRKPRSPHPRSARS